MKAKGKWVGFDSIEEFKKEAGQEKCVYLVSSDGMEGLVTAYDTNDNTLHVGWRWWSLDEIAGRFTFLDGRRCAKFVPDV